MRITRGAHHRYWPVGEGQAAHEFDALEAEGVPNQAQNFIRYATALQVSGPFILIAPIPPPDEAEAAHIQVEMCDFRQIVETALNTKVYVQ